MDDEEGEEFEHVVVDAHEGFGLFEGEGLFVFEFSENREVAFEAFEAFATDFLEDGCVHADFLEDGYGGVVLFGDLINLCLFHIRVFGRECEVFCDVWEGPDPERGEHLAKKQVI